MRKKIITYIIIFLSFFFILNVDASKTDKVCTEDSKGRITIRYDNAKQRVGSIYATYREGVRKTKTVEESGYTYSKKTLAAIACEERLLQLDPCKYADEKTSCSFGAYCEYYYQTDCGNTGPAPVANASIDSNNFITEAISSENKIYLGRQDCDYSSKSSCENGKKDCETCAKYERCWYRSSGGCSPAQDPVTTDPDCASGQYKNKPDCVKNCNSYQYCVYDNITMCYYRNCKRSRSECEKYFNVTDCEKVNNSGCWSPITCDDSKKNYKYVIKDYYYVTDPNSPVHEGTQDIHGLKYVIDTGKEVSEGDLAYCLQPGAHGPNKGKEYKLDTTFNVANCRDSLHRKDGSWDFRCGLAHILFETVELDSETGKYVYKSKYKLKDGTVKYGVITFALRLWVAEYAYNSGFGIGKNLGHEASLNWVADEDYYTRTADAMLKNYNGTSGSSKYDKQKLKIISSSNKNIIGCGTSKSDSCGILLSKKLLESAFNARDPEKFMNGVKFGEPVSPKISYYHETRDEGTTIVDIPEEITTVTLPCTEEDYKKGVCDIKVKYYDSASGDEITKDIVQNGKCYYYVKDKNQNDVIVDSDYCQKHSCKMKCEVKIKITEKTCEKYQSSSTQIIKLQTKVFIDKWKEKTGYIRFYTQAQNPSDYQKMITFAFKLQDCQSTHDEYLTTETTTDTITTIQCPCNPEKRCMDEDVQIKDNLKYTCNDSSYTESTVSEPSINCILNTCYQSDREKYEETESFSANRSICKIYCREDIKIYLPGKTSVYAGMQFTYDLAGKLGKKTNLNSTGLVSIVKTSKQCASEIDYKVWYEEFQKRVDSRASDRDIKELVYELYNCNLYNQSDIPSEYRVKEAVAGRGSSKDSAIYISLNSCSMNAGCPTLIAIDYPEEKYKDTIKIEVATINTVNENIKTKYCTNGSSKCYEFEKGKSSIIEGGNSVEEEVTYKDVTVKVPKNDYAGFEFKTERGYFNGTEYSTEAYSGNVIVGEGNGMTSISLPKYSFPVDVNTPTGIGNNAYNIKFKFAGVLPQKQNNYQYTCTYDVYNTTTLYDCEYRKSDGTIDISRCKNNSSSEVEKGIPNLTNVNWESKSNNTGKDTGFYYRTVDLSDLFPNGQRDAGINWVGTDDQSKDQVRSIIRRIESSAEDIYTNNDYLNYRYVLTPTATKMIRNYNASQSSNGGYQNNTLTGCTVLTTNDNQLPTFTNCKSTFLRELKSNNYSRVGVQVSGNRS